MHAEVLVGIREPRVDMQEQVLLHELQSHSNVVDGSCNLLSMHLFLSLLLQEVAVKDHGEVVVDLHRFVLQVIDPLRVVVEGGDEIFPRCPIKVPLAAQVSDKLAHLHWVACAIRILLEGPLRETRSLGAGTDCTVVMCMPRKRACFLGYACAPPKYAP